MLTVRTLPQFDAWLAGLRDGPTRQRLVARLRRAQLGILGDVKPVGPGVYEMREDVGPGWRMYYARRGAQIIVMLGGGEKSSQTKDIARALRLSALLED